MAKLFRCNQGNLTSEQLSQIINQYLTGGDKLRLWWTDFYWYLQRFGEFDQVNGKVEIVTTGLWSGDTGSLTSFFTSSTRKIKKVQIIT